MADFMENGKFMADKLGDCDQSRPYPEYLAQGAAAWLVYNFDKIEAKSVKAE